LFAQGFHRHVECKKKILFFGFLTVLPVVLLAARVRFAGCPVGKY
jgi:hypothetical protein